MTLLFVHLLLTGCGPAQPAITLAPTVVPETPLPTATLQPTVASTSLPTATRALPSALPAAVPPTVSPTAVPPTPLPPGVSGDPADFISSDSLFDYLEDLTAIQAYSGWRNSVSLGEAEALDYVARTLDGFVYLQGLGLSLERQSFHVFMGMDIHTSDLFLTLNGQEIEVPADMPRGDRDDLAQALCFDSDGRLNDADLNEESGVYGGTYFAATHQDLLDRTLAIGPRSTATAFGMGKY